MFDDFGDFELSVQCVSSKKSTSYIMGAPRVLERRGYWRVELITLINPTSNLCPVSERNHVK